MCSTAEELLQVRAVLEHFEFRMDTTLWLELERSRFLGDEDALAAELRRDRGLQIKAVSSKANKADLGTKVLVVARLNALRAACGIVVLGEPTCELVDEDCLANSLGPWVKWLYAQC